MTTLRLHLNENTSGCSPAVADALRSISREDVAGDPDYRPITAAVARWFGVPDDWVLVTNGLDEGLHLAAQSAARGTTRAHRPHALIVEPAFEMYAICADGAELDVVRVFSNGELDFPAGALLSSISAATRLVYLTDPGNPTGTPVPRTVIDDVADEASDALVVVDEAYAEFSGRTIIGVDLDRRRNLIVGRTFAKAFGLAGVRAGALVAHPDTLAPLRKLQPPFSVNVCAVRALEAALDDRAYLDWYVAQSALSRQLITAFARGRGWRCWPSEANFVLMRVDRDATGLVAAAAARGVLIRDKSSAPGCERCIRITAGAVAHTQTCLAVLEECLAARRD